MKKNFLAFTLAEVLITLGIIGVVAALTIPTLVQNYQKKQYVTQLKKAYTTLSQVIKQVAYEGGCPDDLDCAFNGLTPNAIGDLVASKYKVLQNCESTLHQEEGVCFPNNVDEWGLFDSKNSEKYYDGGDLYRFVTADGTAYAWELGAGPYYSTQFVVDVNGPKKGPNQVGRDIHDFKIQKDTKLVPFSSVSNLCNSVGKSPLSCTARIMEEGWEMNY